MVFPLFFVVSLDICSLYKLYKLWLVCDLLNFEYFVYFVGIIVLNNMQGQADVELNCSCV